MKKLTRAFQNLLGFQKNNEAERFAAEKANWAAQKALLESDKAFVTRDLYALNDRHQEALQNVKKNDNNLNLLKACGPPDVRRWLELLEKSTSQLHQDLFVLSETGMKRSGYFVEFGACDGIELSNTLLLERHFDWQGILAEPARVWHTALGKNRNCHIDQGCVWSKTGEHLQFNEVAIPGLSSLESHSFSDLHAEARKNGSSYVVETISLMDLLAKYQAPFEIDYLSIDTEGSEFEILKSLDFSKYRFKVITCEHNFSDRRQDIYQLLIQQGYHRKHVDLSQFDDWYVLNP